MGERMEALATSTSCMNFTYLRQMPECFVFVYSHSYYPLSLDRCNFNQSNQFEPILPILTDSNCL